MKPLTKYRPGSVAELLTISIPLIITALSGNLMVVIDRIMLSYYSIDATNAVAGAGVVFAAFYFPGIAIAGITEVFVGQYNGSQQYKKIAAPVWQMLWFSVSTIAIYTPLALWGDRLFLAEAFIEKGLGYYQLLVLVTPLFVLQNAISGFFIGIGETKKITFVVVFGNAIKVLLNFPLIFGYAGVEPLGAMGAAVSSVVSEVIQLVILCGMFLSKKYNAIYFTRKISVNFQLFKEQLKVGIPHAAGHSFEIAGWAFLTNFRANFGVDFILVMTVTSTSYILFTFFTDGVSKGIASIVSNMIGANDTDGIQKVKRSAYKLQMGVGILLLIPLVVLSDLSINSLVDRATISDQVIWAMKMGMLGNYIFMVIDGYFWI